MAHKNCRDFQFPELKGFMLEIFNEVIPCQRVFQVYPL